MFSKRKILASFFTAALLVVGLSGAENSALVSDTTSSWASSENVRSGNLTSADFSSQVATYYNLNSYDYMVTDAVFPKFRQGTMWSEWTDGNTERVSHIAIRRHPDMPRSDVTMYIDSVSAIERWPGSRDFAANFSWELYNLRGFSGNWDRCSVDRISAIRAYNANTNPILMATGNTMTGLTRRNAGSVSHNLVNPDNSDRDANLCLIIKEFKGTNYRFSSLSRCMYFEFNINMTTRVTGAATGTWRQPLTITTEMLNMGHPNQYTPQNCAAG